MLRGPLSHTLSLAGLSTVCFFASSFSQNRVAWGQTGTIQAGTTQTVAKPEEGKAPAPATADENAKDNNSSAGDTKSSKSAETAPRSSVAKPEPAKRATKDRAKETAKPPAKKQVQRIELSGNYVDLAQPLGLDATSLLLGGSPAKQKSFFRLCDHLDDLAKNDAVVHVVFDLSDSVLAFNPAQLDELARRLGKLKSAGKKTTAWLENPSNVQMSIASSCDKVILADFGGVDMPSMSMQSMFYRDAMDFLGVQASVVRAGNFKGAVEPYLNPQMSSHLREHYLEMLSSINDAQVDRIARGRGLTVAQVRELQKKRMLLPAEAQAKGLVDQLAPYGSMKETITKIIGEEFEWTKPKSTPKKEMSMFELMSILMSGDKKVASNAAKEDSIAVLHLSGAIEDGKKESPGAIVSGPTVKAIQELLKDEKVKGVVVRINSPGGSATASESIRRGLAELAKAKPTIISMGEMAASGGYWISCIGQPIYAEQGTITGSIGVFSLKISFGTLFRRVGVHVESIALDPAAESDAMNRPWSDADVETMQAFIDDVYGKFLKLVSESRGISVETLADLAGGRVWSGTQAKQHRLVDEIGGLDDALAAVAKKADLDTYKVLHRPNVRSGFDLLELLGEEDSNDIRINQLLSSAVFQQLREQGFSLIGTAALLRSAVHPQTRGPQAWALLPNEFLIK